MTDHLVFSHANGFPAPVYRQLLERLGKRFSVSSVPRFGHDPAHPVGPGWHALRNQLVGHVKALEATTPIWLVGHSLGGYLSVLAASVLGKRVAGVILVDSPLIDGMAATVVRWGRCTGLDRLVMPLQQTLQRRTRWPDIGTAYTHFAAKPSFARWDPTVLLDYAAHGTVAAAEGERELWFRRDIEYSIYRTLPTRSVAAAARALSMPVGFVGGTASREIRHIGMRATRRVVGANLRWLQGGGHLFPMERPAESERQIVSLINGFQIARKQAA